MVGWQRSDGAIAYLHRLFQLDGVKSHERFFSRGNFGEVRPHCPVENMLPQYLDHFCRRMHCQRSVAHVADGIDDERQAGDMIKMRVRDEYMVNLRQIRDRQVSNARTGINQDIVIDNDRSRPQVPATDATTAAENTDLHAAASGKAMTGENALMSFGQCLFISYQISKNHPSQDREAPCGNVLYAPYKPFRKDTAD